MINLQTRCDSMDHLSDDDSILIHKGDYDVNLVEISIVIPTFKRSTLLEETLRSCQRIYGNEKFEILVIFNQQNEAKNVLGLIKGLNINNIRIFENTENIGMFQNWNQGIRLSYGKWISIMHDDDMFENRFFDCVEHILSSVNDDVVYINFKGKRVTNEKFMDTVPNNNTKLTFISPTIKDTRIFGMSPFFATTCGTLLKKSVIEAMGGFDAETYPSGDVLLPIKLINNGYTCYICRQNVNYYRVLENASIKKDVMESFIYFYIELQQTIYSNLNGVSKIVYNFFKDCLSYKSVWHVFCQAEKHNIMLDAVKPDLNISKRLRYKVMDIFQRVHWRFLPTKLTIHNRGK